MIRANIRLFRVTVAALGFAALQACGHVTREQLLYQQSAAFHNDVRWKRLENASVRVVPWEREKFFAIYRESVETLQIEDYELENVKFPAPGDTGYQDEPTQAVMNLLRFETEAPDVTRRKSPRAEKWLYNGDAWFIYGGY